MGKPKIRFKGYEDDWEQRKLSEIAIEKLSNGIMNNQANDETGLRHINVINMYDPDKIHPEKLTFSNYDEDAVKKCNVEWGDIFLTRSSLKPEGIAESNVLLDSGRFVYDDHLIRLKLDKEKYDPFFVKLNLSGSIFKRQFIARAKTTAFTTIGQEDIAECFGLFPEKEEQEKIGTYFSNLDHLITLHQRKCEETKSLKKYMLQKMFPENGKCVPEIRFSGFSDDWEQRKVSEIGNIVTGSTPKTSISDNYGGEFLFVSPADIQENRYVDETITTLTKKGFDQGRKIREKASLFVSIGSTIGKVAQTSQESTTNQQINAVEPYDNFDDDFIFTSLENISGSIKAIASNQAVPIVNKTTFGETEIKVPSELAEQQKIGAYFRNLDHLITLHQHKCDELQKLKKFMLQNMFV